MTNAEIEKNDRLSVSPGGRPDTLALYLSEACNHPLLTPEEERRLGLLKQEGKLAKITLTKSSSPFSDEERKRLNEMIFQGEKARALLIDHNLRLVVSVAKGYIGLGLPFTDLIQEGNIGLMKAVEKYDPDKGKKFSTYAFWWIKQATLRAITEQRRIIRLPIHADEELRKIMESIDFFMDTFQDPPTIEQISQKTGFKPKKIIALIHSSKQLLSLDQPVGEEEEDTLSEFIADNASPNSENLLFDEGLGEALKEVLKTLTQREERILRLRFGLGNNDGPYTLEQIGEKFGLTKERIRQIEHSAFKKLRHPSRSRLLERLLR